LLVVDPSHPCLLNLSCQLKAASTLKDLAANFQTFCICDIFSCPLITLLYWCCCTFNENLFMLDWSFRTLAFGSLSLLQLTSVSSIPLYFFTLCFWFFEKKSPMISFSKLNTLVPFMQENPEKLDKYLLVKLMKKGKFMIDRCLQWWFDYIF